VSAGRRRPAALITPIGVLTVLAVAGLTGAPLCLTRLSYRHGLAAPLAVSTVTNPVAAAAIGILLLGEHLRAAGTVIAGRQFAATLPHTRTCTAPTRLRRGGRNHGQAGLRDTAPSRGYAPGCGGRIRTGMTRDSDGTGTGAAGRSRPVTSATATAASSFLARGALG
jgi:hypothetical protein